MSFSIISAVGKNNELGKNNGLIFRIPEDQKFFKTTTMSHKIVMGRKTFESIGRPLPGRKNYVITTSKTFSNENVEIISDLEKFIKENKDSSEEIFIIGGASVYKQFLPVAKIIYLTEIDAEEKSADVFFPEFKKSSYKKSNLLASSYNNINFEINKYERES
ncbi:dihydrofolate reductase [Candidatus Saccharibacteria bacterium]|nr:dihydrofolate reductase [Candidatus Saccharibacteria bacterium]